MVDHDAARPTARTNARPAGGVRPARFLMLTGPATVAALGIAAGIVMGYVGAAIAVTHPMDLATSRGTADSLRIATATAGDVTGIGGRGADRGTAKIQVDRPRLDDLCLLPRVTLPFVGKVAWLRITSDAPVGLGSVVLAAGEGTLGGLTTPHTVIGGAAGDFAPTRPGGFLVATKGDPGEVELRAMGMQAYGLVLDEGMRMSRIALMPGLGPASCSQH